MKPIALVTAQAARNRDVDLPPLAQALTDAYIAHEIVCWDDAAIDWWRFRTVLLRSPWDYVPRLAEFLDWAKRVSAQTRLLNPLPLIRWNTDKRYLEDLHRAGIAIVPSTFVAADADALGALKVFLDAHDSTEFVVKPCVGAGARDAARYHRDEQAVALAHLQRMLAQGRHVMMQPYLDRVDADGETALIYFNGVFSHAIRKGPLLRRGANPSSALFAAEQIVARVPGEDELALAQQAIDVMARDTRFAAMVPLLYLRVDLLRRNDGSPCLLELETTEPSLFFDQAFGSATRFVEALLRH